MWYYNSEIIKTPKTMVIGGYKYGPGLFQDVEKLKELGFKDYIITKSPDERYFGQGTLSIDASGDTVTGVYDSIGKDTDSLKKKMLRLIKKQLSSKLNAIDWHWMKALKTGTDVPSEIQKYADALYSEYETKKTEIADMSKLSQIMEYENRPHTQITKVRHDGADGKTTWGPDTDSSGISINMCEHWTSHPYEINPQLVSLTAD